MAAGTAPWSLARKDTTHPQNQAKEIHHQAAAEGATGLLKGCEEKLAGSPKTSGSHVNTRRLQERKDSTTMKARYRYHVTVFQRVVYSHFRKVLLEKPRGSLDERRVARPLATMDGVLETLDVLKVIQGRNDNDAKAYFRDFDWVKTEWDRIVAGLGLPVTEYEALLREFKKYSLGNYGILEEEEEEEEADAEESLRALESDEFRVLPALKEPLVKLLKIVRGKK